MNLKAKIIDRKEIAQGVIQLDWQILDKQELRFSPGQHFSITLPELFYPDPRGPIRYFSIILNPEAPTNHFSTVTRLSKSGYKRSLMRLSFGRPVELGSVSGHFIMPPADTRPLVFLAGGIGITPFIAILRQLQTQTPTNHWPQAVCLLYSNRNEESAALLPELKNYERQIDNFKLHLIMTQQSDWSGDSAFLSHQTIQEQVADYKNAYYLAAGPPGFVRTAANSFDRLGIKPAQYLLEEFIGYDS